MKRSSVPQRGGQRGVASLIVVMVLFFVVSLMAAYTSRNLIFEQKTSANQARSTLAFEAADAGVNWALAQLNGGVVNDQCGDTSPALSFQQRYVAIDANGNISQRAPRAGNWPSCVFNGTGWTCACPDGTNVDPNPLPTGTGPFPAFRVWPAAPEAQPTVTSPFAAWSPPRPGMLGLSSVGCTKMPASGEKCLDYQPETEIGDGTAALRTMLVLRSGLAVPPAAAITVREALTPAAGAAKLMVVNDADTGSAGLTVNTGSTLSPSQIDAKSLPGTPSEMSFADGDARLVELSTVATGATPLSAGERMFVSMFGMLRSTYLQQPGLRVCNSPCTAGSATTVGSINYLLAKNPHRIIWAEGNVTIDAPVGDAASPVLLIVNGGTLTFSGGHTVYGFIYLTGGTVNLPGAATSIRGALAAESSLATAYASGSGAAGNELTVTYDRAVLDKLRTSYGSWVRLGGSWHDFKEPNP